MNQRLPHFRYHPNPVESGAVVARTVNCACCKQARSHVYVGPVYAAQDYSERICPWCIFSGAAARELGVEFTDCQSLAAAGVQANVVDEVATRTPGYSSWQGAEWLSHCGDACAFLGDATASDIASAQPETISDWCKTNAQDERGWRQATDGYVPGGQPAFYKFQCLHCDKLRLHWDFH